DPAGALEIDADRPFAPVDDPARRGLVPEPGLHPAHVVADARLLDLDDLCAEIGEQRGREAAGQQPREVQHADAVEQAAHRRLPSSPSSAARWRNTYWSWWPMAASRRARIRPSSNAREPRRCDAAALTRPSTVQNLKTSGSTRRPVRSS